MERLYLKGITKLPRTEEWADYPFQVPVIKELDTLEFTKPVTIFCGNNGCGKTTLLELLAAKLSAVRISEVFRDQEKEKAFQKAERAFRIWRERPAKRNFYFSAEEFIQYIKWIEREKAEARQAIEEVEEEYLRAGRSSYAMALAKQPYQDTLMALNSMYDASLARQSHGQGYLDFFSNRLMPGGLYLLDEPEGALSYENQYVLALMILRSVQNGCQFFLSTHSPVLTAIPDADILEIQEGSFVHTSYGDLDNMRFLNLFLSQREQMFHPSLWQEE